MKPSDLAVISTFWPKNPVPLAVPAVVIDTYRPGLLRCRICAAPSSLLMAAVFSYSGSSRSKSTALSEYLLMTCWYAAAVAEAVPHVWPSFVPPNPPIEMDTSPPAPRILLMMLATVVSEDTGAVPSHVGLQPPPLGARMNASSKDFCPVAAMTVGRSGGLFSSGITYAAAPYQLLGSVAACAEPALTARTAPPTVTPALTIAPRRVNRRTGVLRSVNKLN